jgi:ferric-dicitrate binding protein FerR (iron transport regulator)
MPSITEERLVELITNHLAGDLTELEQVELTAWVQTDLANRLLLDKISNEDEVRTEIERWKNIQPSKGYEKWFKALRVRQRGKIIRIAGWAAAACLAGVLAGVWLIPKYSRKDLVFPAVTANTVTVPPGRNTAVLTLSNGRQVLLDSAGNGDLAVQGNARLVKIDDGSLSYKAVGGGAGEEVLYNTLSTPRSGQYQLILPDGSHVWLNNLSSIRYPVSFRGKDRTVELTGEAYLEVTKDPTKPFIVKVKDESIEVLGTSFNVMAYAEEDAISTTLLTGSVRVKKDKKSVVLKPDEQVRVNAAGDLKVLHDVPSEDIVSWKNGFFYFGRASLKEVMRQLARWYDVEVVYAGAVPDVEFGGKVDRSLPLNDLLQFLDRSNVHFRLEGRKLIVLPS